MEISFQRNDKIIKKKFFQYLFPTIAMVLAMQFGSLADAIIVGNFLGDNFLSATSLALPIVFLVEIPGFAIATGACIVGANLIGKRLVDDASKTFKISIALSFLISLIFIPMGFLLAGPIAKWFAGNFDYLEQLIFQYIQSYFFQAPILGVGLVVAYFLPSDNHPNLGAAYFIVSNIVHLAFEILFALVLPKDIVMYGVGLSTCIGMAFGLIVLIFYAKSKRRTILLNVKMKGSLKLSKDVFKAGSSAGVMTALSCVFYLVLNLAATAYLKDVEMPLFAMLSNFSFVIDLCIVGVLQVMPSIIPALYGDKDYYSVRAVTRYVLLISMGITVVLLAISLIFPQLFFYIFGVDLAQIQDGFAQETLSGLKDPLAVVRIYVLSFLVYTINKFLINYYPSILVNLPGIVSNVVRLGAVGPVTVYFLMQAFGVSGFAYGTIIIEAATALATVCLVLIGLKLHRFPGSGILLLPKKVDEKVVDISIPSELEEVTKASEQLQRIAFEHCGSETSSAMVALACEEMLTNIVSYGYKRNEKAQYIDVNLSFYEDKMLVRVRDDGVIFDPTSYVEGDDESLQFNGIEVVKKVAKEFRYLRILNTNNTIIEIQVSPN